MDRITRYARPHCYDASRGPLSFLDNGQRSRSSPRINVDSITRKACPERQPSDSTSSIGIGGSRLRAQSTDSLTWRRAVALKTKQHVISSRQHQSHAELRTDSSECLFGTVVVDFSDSQIGEAPPVFDSPKPLQSSTPRKTIPNGTSTSDNYNSDNCDIIRKKDRQVNLVETRGDDKADLNESRVRPVVETVAVLGRRLSYSKAAGADRLDPSDLDELARQIGLIHDESTNSKPSKASSRSQTILNKSIESLKQSAEMESAELGLNSTPHTADTPPLGKDADSRSRKGKMGWLGGLFRRLRHWPDSSTSSGESKKHRRRARSLPPSSKGRSNNSEVSDQQTSTNPPSTANESPPTKKSSFKGFNSSKSSLRKREVYDKSSIGVSRSRTVDDIERARAYSHDEPELVMPKLNTTFISDSPPLPSAELNLSTTNGHTESPRNEIHEDKKSSTTNGKSSSQAPSYCNLAILAYGYSVAYPGLDIHDTKKKQTVKESHVVNTSEVNKTHDESEKPIVVHVSEEKSEDNEQEACAAEPLAEDVNDQQKDKTEKLAAEEIASDVIIVREGTGEQTSGDKGPLADSDETEVFDESIGDRPGRGDEVSKVSDESAGYVKSANEEKIDGGLDLIASELPEVNQEATTAVSQADDQGEKSDGNKTDKECDISENVQKDNSNSPPEVETSKSTPRVTINVNVDVVELNNTSDEKESTEHLPIRSDSSKKGRESPNIVVRRKKTVSCSEAPDSLSRSSLIMLAVSQASPRPKTEMINPALMRNSTQNPMSVSQHEDIVPSGSEEKDGFYFLRLASEVESEFRVKMDKIDEDLVTDGEKMNEEVSGILRSVVGKANLLLTDKFSQLRGLCQQNISEQVDPGRQLSSLTEGFATRNSDLDGYWALVQLQVDDVKAQFCRVEKLRNDGWQLPSDRRNSSAKVSTISRPGPVKRKKKIPSSAKSTQSAVSQARLEARKRLENAKREAASKLKSAHNNSDGDVFIFV